MVIPRQLDQLVFQRKARLQHFTEIYPPLEANTERLMQLYDGHLQQAIDDDNCMTFQQV
jgi:regulator of sigma D